MNITIGWLYKGLMSTYGDRGNIIVLQKRCEWRGINVEIKNLDLGFKVEDLRKCDLLFMGGAQDMQQKIVSNDFTAKKVKTLKEKINSGIPGLYICGAYQFLGKYYKEADGTIIKGLGVFDLYTENPGENYSRLIGNIVLKTQDSIDPWGVKLNLPQGRNSSDILVGFENHGGKTYLGRNIKPFATVIKGFGNNGEDKTEGAIYKNSIGTYLHGPILPKNPEIADWLIGRALEKKYEKKITLEKLNDSLSQKAKLAILQRMTS